MQAYTGFAEVYDRFMNNVPYDQWEAFLAELLRQRGIRDGLVLELGCGTGIMTERMAARGYDMIGLDLSEDMLAEAVEKRSLSGQNILYLNQDMREFELYGTVAAVYCICDSLNYITCAEDLIKVFRLVNNYLDPEGVFLFDFNTPVEYRSPLRQAPIVEEQDGITMIWENEYREEECLNEHRLTFFLPLETEPYEQEDCDGVHEALPVPGEEEKVYAKVQETHEQRAWTLPEMQAALKAAGMIWEECFDMESGSPAAEDSRRILCVARERGKQKPGSSEPECISKQQNESPCRKEELP